MKQIYREQLKAAGFSEDVLPPKPEDRSWNIGNYAAIWMGLVHNIPNYIAVGGLFA
ncbi:hypothetical protein ACFVSW_01360 [Neobacillus sp. NPDC058068]|uniref:hypothetical protein n=1 Tax=Neobacillus sp. NPDC058068 TaxID=3346325 RepID=UPI0036DBC11D